MSELTQLTEAWKIQQLSPSPEPSLLSGVNVLLEGLTGTGKTTALATIAEAVPELFIVFTEPGLESFIGYWTDKGKKVPENVHWHVMEQEKGNFSLLAENAKIIRTYTIESLFKMQDPQRSRHDEYEKFLRTFIDFPDDRTGKKFGPVDSWGPNRCIAIDSLTGINHTAFSLIIGNKPLKDQRDWGMAQDLIEKFVRQLTGGCECHFVLTAHVERELDQVFGGVKVTVSTLGKALAPKIPPMFSDVVLAYREAKNFYWSTANPQADLKTRNLPLADGIAPNFKQIFDKWQSRGGRFTQDVKK